MSTTKIDAGSIYESVRPGLSYFFAGDGDWEDIFHTAFLNWFSRGTPDMGDWSVRDRTNYFIRSVKNERRNEARRVRMTAEAAKCRYYDTPFPSLKYKTDGDLVLAIRNLYEKGYTIRTIATAANMTTQRVGAMVKRRTYRNLD